MTFKETEFPATLKYLKAAMAADPDPLLIKEVLAQIIKLYEAVPLYPGIANMCAAQAVKAVEPKDVAVGQKIYFQKGNVSYLGTVAEKTADGLKLKAVKAAEEDVSVSLKDMSKVKAINEKILEELWPSLVFEKVK
ncbi:MAG TPA: hypothetical protein P5079_01060 [Elusimicrobiota bacterium]|nr:hypothetical protein [Elusimicrobiota bacterium]